MYCGAKKPQKKKKLRKSFEVFVDSLLVDLAQSSGRTVLSIGPHSITGLADLCLTLICLRGLGLLLLENN